MNRPAISEIITTTLRDRSGDFYDNVTSNNALLTILKNRGLIQTSSGGRVISKPLYYAENSNFNYYSGGETLDISAANVITMAEYDWVQAAVNVTMTGLEERQNSGENALLNLVVAKVENAKATMSNNICNGLYSDGTGSNGKEIGGLQLLVADDPTTGTVGGLDRATQTWWRNKVYDASVEGVTLSSSTIQTAMNSLYLDLIRGNDKPDLIVSSTDYYTFYEDSVQSRERFVDENMASVGFENYKYKSATVVPENNSGFPTSRMYMLNTKYIGLEAHKDANMTPNDAKESVNQDGFVIPILWMGNMCLTNASLQGVILP